MIYIIMQNDCPIAASTNREWAEEQADRLKKENLDKHPVLSICEHPYRRYFTIQEIPDLCQSKSQLERLILNLQAIDVIK